MTSSADDIAARDVFFMLILFVLTKYVLHGHIHMLYI